MLRYIPPEGPADLVQAWREAMAAGERLACLTASGHFWQDLGTPEHYLTAHQRLLSGASPKLARYFPRSDRPLDRPRGQDRGRGAIWRRGLSRVGGGGRRRGLFEKYGGVGPGCHQPGRGVGRLHCSLRRAGKRFRPGPGSGGITQLYALPKVFSYPPSPSPSPPARGERE